MANYLRIGIRPIIDGRRGGIRESFGMDAEGADYRACETYGPIYK